MKLVSTIPHVRRRIPDSQPSPQMTLRSTTSRISIKSTTAFSRSTFGPFVELSFMPMKMASDPAKLHPFWYHPNVSPPKRYDDWDKMMRAFAQHLVDRYGMGRSGDMEV